MYCSKFTIGLNCLLTLFILTRYSMFMAIGVIVGPNHVLNLLYCIVLLYCIIIISMYILRLVIVLISCL